MRNFAPLGTKWLGYFFWFLRKATAETQIGVGDSKYVIVFDPLLTGHVIRRMRSGSVRIFNGNQLAGAKFTPEVHK